MITVQQQVSTYEVVPQVIFWRPLRYFATTIQTDEDELDQFEYASFSIGNTIAFDLRRYRGHPNVTVTLYLPFTVEDPDQINEMIDKIINTLNVPEYAVAWRRGDLIDDKPLERQPHDRLREQEARILALKIAAQQAAHTSSIEFIKKAVPSYFSLSPVDMVRSTSRPNEQRWQQIVGNVTSHENSSAGPFRMGYAVRTDDGLRVTEEGLSYLNSMGFSV